MSNAASILPSLVEQRRDVRHGIGADIQFASETQELAGTACDVSLGGACIATYRVLPARTPLRVRLVLPQGVVYADAKVRWVELGTNGGPGKLGIEWTDLSEIDQSLLQALEDEATPAPAVTPPVTRHASVLRLRAR